MLAKGELFFSIFGGILFFPAYGLTETSPASHYDSVPSKVGTVGHLLPNANGKVLSYCIWTNLCQNINFYGLRGKKTKLWEIINIWNRKHKCYLPFTGFT